MINELKFDVIFLSYFRIYQVKKTTRIILYNSTLKKETCGYLRIIIFFLRHLVQFIKKAATLLLQLQSQGVEPSSFMNMS